MPIAIDAMIGRVWSNVFMAVRKPALAEASLAAARASYRASPPSRFSAGTRHSSKTSSAVSLARRPIFSSMRPTEKPGVPASTTKAR